MDATISTATPVPTPSFQIPKGFKIHTENTTSILLPDTADTFLNPVQEFNRDLSVACIRTWSEDMNEKKKAKWEKRLLQRKKDASHGAVKRAIEGELPSPKRMKGESEDSPQLSPKDGGVVDAPITPAEDIKMAEPADVPSDEAQKADAQYHSQKFVILEALSATGLRSIRYAKEIPLVHHVIANDLSPAATAAMRRNVELNDLGPGALAPDSIEPTQEGNLDSKGKGKCTIEELGKVRINEGDACDLMYSHRPERLRVDVVDLDPYGTAAPFIDAAVQCIKDDGLLCVTCTDLTVLASGNYPEKCFSNYGGIPAKAEYCHEVALRLVLHTLATSAARYGRFITPVLSLSIDFYVRLFVKVRTAPIEVKKAMVNTSLFHICTSCQSAYPEPLGRVVEKSSAKSGNVNLLFKTTPSSPNTDTCEECGGKLHVAGPMWSGPIHDPAFVSKVLQHVEEKPDRYNTHARMKGMLTVASEELPDPFYFTPARVASHFHCECPSIDETASAILNAGYAVSRSHACPGSLKTSAPRSMLHDIMRTWIADHPVKIDRIKEESAKTLLSKPIGQQADFTRHPGLDAISSKIKLVRYPVNPPKWGPGSRPDSGKRKREAAKSVEE